MLTVISKKVDKRNFREVIIPNEILVSSALNTKGFYHTHIIHESKAKEKNSKVYEFIEELVKARIEHEIIKDDDTLFLSITWSNSISISWREEEK